MAHYYNEWNAYRAEWIRNLIRDGLIPDGEVDERGIEEVEAKDLDGFTQCHWFAGIAGWPLALRLANWFPDIPAWTGSCPCQPLSCAGKREGEKDVRHLWPVFYRLICKRRPPVVYGEQTASGDGPEWVAGVRLDLEAAGYRVGVAILPAAGVHAPHRRQRLYWVGHANSARRQRRGKRPHEHAGIRTARSASPWRDCGIAYCRLPGGSTRMHKRRIEPRTQPLVDGFPTRVEQVSAYGDSIVPACAAEFVKAFVDVRYAEQENVRD